MAVVTITRFTINPADAEELQARHAALVAAFRSAGPGLADARLGRLHDDTWIGVWRWDSGEQLQEARRKTPTLAEATAAFSVARDATVEDVELVDQQ